MTTDVPQGGALMHRNRFLHANLRVCATYRRGNEIVPVYEDALPAFGKVLKGRIKNHYQNVVAVTGRTGSGKSTTAIRLAYAINPHWDLAANYIYSTEDLKRKLSGRPYSDPVSLFDECSVSLNSNNSMQKEDKTMVVLFDTMRSLGWTSILCVPNINTLNKRVREYHVDYMIMCPNRSPLRGYDPRSFVEIYEHKYRDWGDPYYKLRAVSLTRPLEPSRQKQYDRIKLEHQEMILKDFIYGKDGKGEKNGENVGESRVLRRDRACGHRAGRRCARGREGQGERREEEAQGGSESGEARQTQRQELRESENGRGRRNQGRGTQMMVIIVSSNHARLNKIRKQDLDKHFFLERAQCYKVYPDGLTRMRVRIDGVAQESEEVIVYSENAIVPDNPRALDYSQERIISEIQTHKLMTPTGLLGKTNIWMRRAEQWRIALTPYLGIIIVGIVLLYAFLA